MYQIQINEVLCLNHRENIEFLDFNQNVPLGLRALCKKCKLINPTNIEEALNKWNQFKGQYVKDIEQQCKQMCLPIKEIKSTLIRIKKTMNEKIDDALHLSEFLIQPTFEYKDQQIEELESLGKTRTLSSLQQIAQIICENKQVNLNQVIKKYMINENVLKIKKINNNLDSVNQKYQLLLQSIRQMQNRIRSKDLLKKGNDLYQKENYDEAIQFYDKAISVNPEFYDAFFCKGNALYEIKKYNESVQCFDEAIRFNPQYCDAFNNEGIALKEYKNYDEAARCYDEAMRIISQFSQGFNNQANQVIAISEQTKYDEDFIFYDQQINPQYSQVFYKKGKALLRLKQFNEAILSFDLSIRLDPQNSLAFYYKGMALQELEIYDVAFKLYNKAIALSQNNCHYIKSKGDILLKLGNINEAIKYYQKAINLGYDDPQELNAKIVLIRK